MNCPTAQCDQTISGEFNVEYKGNGKYTIIKAEKEAECSNKHKAKIAMGSDSKVTATVVSSTCTLERRKGRY